MEILITLIIVLFVCFTIYKTVRKSSKGECNCNSCSNHCPMYEDKKNVIKLQKKK